MGADEPGWKKLLLNVVSLPFLLYLEAMNNDLFPCYTIGFIGPSLSPMLFVFLFGNFSNGNF